MTSVELSRRVGKLMTFPPISEHTYEQRVEFLRAVVKAQDFDVLPDECKQQIEEAEQVANRENKQ